MRLNVVTDHATANEWQTDRESQGAPNSATDTFGHH